MPRSLLRFVERRAESLLAQLLELLRESRQRAAEPHAGRVFGDLHSLADLRTCTHCSGKRTVLAGMNFAAAAIVRGASRKSCGARLDHGDNEALQSLVRRWMRSAPLGGR